MPERSVGEAIGVLGVSTGLGLVLVVVHEERP